MNSSGYLSTTYKTPIFITTIIENLTLFFSYTILHSVNVKGICFQSFAFV